MWTIYDTFGAIHPEVAAKKDETKSHDYSFIK
ncbi:hypothetical protein SAMN04487786_0712 [Paenisporosarcina quisquiliarum]|nr:hypothetical protein SAMN04487786_0712 [Paenisporosarcina quisquiliarum]